MKASDYFEKYSPKLQTWSLDDQKLPPFLNDHDLYTLIMDFNHETQDIIKTRHIQFDRAMPALLKEQNDKWNALCRLFEKKSGGSPIRLDGFKLFWEHQFKEKGVK